MKQKNTINGVGIGIVMATSALFNACINNDFDLQKIKTDNLTLFGDSITIPLGSTKKILMSEIITEDVLKDLGMTQVGEKYEFNFKNEEEINSDFSIKDDITFAAPTLPEDQDIETGFGSFSLGNIDFNASVEAMVADGHVIIQGTGTDLSTYSYTYTSNRRSAQPRKQTLSTAGIGRSSNLLPGASSFPITVQESSTRISQSNQLPDGIPISKFYSFQINNTTGGKLTIRLNNAESSQAIQALKCDYSGVKAIFPKELIVAGSGVTTDPSTNRQTANFDTNGALTVTIQKIDYGEAGLQPSSMGMTDMSLEFGYVGEIEVSRPTDLHALAALQSNSTVKLKLEGSLSDCAITAVTAQVKERIEEMVIDDTEINIGSVEVPEMVKSLASLQINPVQINVSVSKLSIQGLTPLPTIGVALVLELPDFCRIKDLTPEPNGTWKYSFADLTKNGFTLPLLIDKMERIPAIQENKINFLAQWIKIKGSVVVPSFRVENVNTISSTPIKISTAYASGLTDGKMVLNQIQGAVESKGSYKIELAMLKDMREGTGDQKIKLENVNFKNPDFKLNFTHTLPTDFHASMILTPYIADEVKGTPVEVNTTLKGGAGQATVVDNITPEEINGLISQLPDSVVLSYTVQGGTPTAPATMKMADMKSINMGALYNVGLPLSFGPEMKITTEGTTDLSLGNDFAEMLFGSDKNKLTLMITAENSIPLGLSVQIIPLDKDENAISGITISPISIKGGTIENDVPVPQVNQFNVEMKGSKEAIASMAKLKYEVSASSSDAKGATIRSDCSLQMSMKIKLLGGINI